MCFSLRDNPWSLWLILMHPKFGMYRLSNNVTTMVSQVCFHVWQVLQLIFWSRNGIMLSELLDLCGINITTWCFIYHILHNDHMLMEIGGLITFKHDQVCTVLYCTYTCAYISYCFVFLS